VVTTAVLTGIALATYISGYRNGDRTLPDENTINAPKPSSINTKGSNHHFFSCRRNRRNSFSNDHIVELL
jgi:hypothetical protein